ncbi:hypothetical protein DERP_003084 [Dermatophagoides pteronyssinus]|uniref:CB1 cannabinoid receptor-interacting protein 1 n=1 Tax=Dermatophagoides pteronyssinus TaxID=6956 RepID=A0ABQ8JIH0_DERPT|nr:hypothetical protein DERP_003084 [Dermatophagoides pteronyssinus]
MEKRSKSQLFFAKKMKMKMIKLQGIPALQTKQQFLMMKKLFCSIFIVDLGNGKNLNSRMIYFKNDGTRFQQEGTTTTNPCSSTTLKLSNQNRYRFRIVLKSIPSTISAVRINDQQISYESQYQENNAELSFEMDMKQMNIDHNNHNHNGHRIRLTIHIDFSDYHHLNIDIQVKLYNQNDSHLTWGQIFRSMITEAELLTTTTMNEQNYIITRMNFLSI